MPSARRQPISHQPPTSPCCAKEIREKTTLEGLHDCGGIFLYLFLTQGFRATISARMIFQQSAGGFESLLGIMVRNKYGVIIAPYCVSGADGQRRSADQHFSCR